jgi:histidine triad (HIT) family protein
MSTSDDLFCRIARHEESAYAVYKDENVMAILDLYPVSRGQVLILPKAHFTWFYEMPDELIGHLRARALRCVSRRH